MLPKQRMTYPSCSPDTVNNLTVLKALGSTGFFFSLFICLNSGVAEQPAVILERTSKICSVVLEKISAR